MTFGVVDLFCGVGGLTCGLKKLVLMLLQDMIWIQDASTHTHIIIHFLSKNIADIEGIHKICYSVS